jgi:diguanylate cyclase (GGDEF)-like protein
MRSAASPVSESMLSAVGDKHGAVAGELAPDILARRARQRRKMLAMVGASYIVDALVLLVYAYAGTTPFTTALTYLTCGLLSVALFLVLSEAKINDRFKEHHLVMQQTGVGLAIMLLFLYIAPEVGCVFLCSIFLVFTFAALRATARQTVIGWTAAVIGLAGLFLFTNEPIAMPHETSLERFATMLVFVLVLGRGMIVGLYSSYLHDSLYKRGLELKEAYKRIEELAELDELTGLLNRRSIMQALDEEIVRARRSGSPLTVALIDLDWFKRINDQYGHPTGDEVLRTFAITMFANIRSIDKFGRYGGEEFLLVLPETANDSAKRTLDRSRAIIADLDWSAISPGMLVTISAGLATLRPEDAPDSLLARADSALYRAKDLGRNQVVVS